MKKSMKHSAMLAYCSRSCCKRPRDGQKSSWSPFYKDEIDSNDKNDPLAICVDSECFVVSALVGYVGKGSC